MTTTMSSGTPLRILMADADAADYERVMRHLAAEGLPVLGRRAATPADLRQALRSGRWDVVLTERHDGAWDPDAILALLEELPHRPALILVSRDPEDPTVAGWLRRGVADHVTKSNLVRLGPAIERIRAGAAAHDPSADEVRQARLRDRIQHDLMEALATATRLEDGLRLCLDAAIRTDGLDCGGIYLANPTDGSLELALHQGVSDAFVEAARHVPPGSPKAQRMRIGEPTYVGLAGLDPGEAAQELSEGLRAYGVLPLRHEGRWIGCMCVASHGEDEIPSAARLTLETIAAGAAQAIARLRAEESLRSSEERYRGIFEESIAAMAVFDRDKRFIDANQACLDLLGYTREELLRLSIPDVDADPSATLPAHGHLLGGGRLINYEHQLRRRDGAVITVLNNARPLTDADGRVVGMLSTLLDITDRKRAQRFQALSSEVLRILNDPQALPDATRRILQAIRRDTGVDAVGIRFRQGEDFPYAATEGFSEAFVEAENSLLARDPNGGFCLDAQGKPRLECTCGLVLSGCTDPANPLFTPFGSAWTNDARPHLHVPSGLDPRLHPRNRCIHEGYRSVAIIPIRAQQHVVGLLQMNSRGAGSFSPETIRFFEGLASSFGVALLRLKDEFAVRQSQHSLRALFDAIPESLFLMGLDGTIQEANGGFAARLGRPVSECVGRSLFSLLPEPIAGTRRAWISRIIESRQSLIREEPWGERWLRHHYCPVIDPQGRVERIVSMAVDFTERRRAETALQDSELRRRLALEAAQMGTWEWDLATGRHTWSEIQEALWGYGPGTFPGTTEAFTSRIHADDLAALWASGEEGRRTRLPFRAEFRLHRPDGSTRWVATQGQYQYDAANQPVRVVGVVSDITERKQLEAQFRQAQKLEAVGQLAGGVAHDFNNIVGGMMLQLGQLRMNESLDDNARQTIRDLDAEAQRAANLIRQLLMFSRRSVLEQRPLDLDQLVRDLLKLLGRLIGEQVHARFCPGAGPLPQVSGDPGMLEQVLVNLVLNARDALPRGGHVTLSTRAVEFDADQVRLHADRRVGHFVCLSVADDGTGMDEATLKHIFEPFFTTKEPGKGTGLGLATVHGIVAQHQGWIEVLSQPGASPIC